MKDGWPEGEEETNFLRKFAQNVPFDPSDTSENTICRGGVYVPVQVWPLVRRFLPAGHLPIDLRRRNRIKELGVLFFEIVKRIIPDETIELEAMEWVYGLYQVRYGNFREGVLQILLELYRENWKPIQKIGKAAQMLCCNFLNARILYKKIVGHYPVDGPPPSHPWIPFWTENTRYEGLIVPRNDSVEARADFENIIPLPPRRVMKQTWTKGGQSTDLIDAVLQFGNLVDVPTIIWRALTNARNWRDRKTRMIDKQYSPSPFRADAILIPRDKYENIKGQRKRVYELWSSGLTTNEIADKLEITTRHARRLVKCFRQLKSDQNTGRRSKKRLDVWALNRRRSSIRSSKHGF
jgi:hypothetical protein